MQLGFRKAFASIRRARHAAGVVKRPEDGLRGVLWNVKNFIPHPLKRVSGRVIFFRRRGYLALAVVLAAFAGPVPVQAGGFGIGGLLLTDPSSAGLSLAAEIGDDFVIAAAGTPAFGRSDILYGHLDFLIDVGPDFDTGAGPLEFYVGAGFRARLLDVDSVGARAPVGMKYHIHATPVEFFVEAAPAFDWIINPSAPGIDDYQIGFQGALGFRYYFGPKANGAAEKS